MTTRNYLHRLAAASAVLVGAFLIVGALGHFSAVLPVIDAAQHDGSEFSLLLPGLILAAAGILSVSLCKALWSSRRWAIDVALAGNALALVYLLFLLWKGVPGHPVAMFTGIVACNVMLLAVTRAGLVWPAAPVKDENGQQNAG